MDIRISPAPLGGCLTAIPSKSDAHRLIICAALADRETELFLTSSSRDIDATCACMRALGAGIERRDDRICIRPIRTVPAQPLLDCEESGSTLRFLLPLAAALCDQVSFTGRGRLPERPLRELTDVMSRHGVSFSAEKLPFCTQGRLQPGEYIIPGNVSSQYITGLLLAAAAMQCDCRIRLSSPLESAAYVDISLHALARFGVKAKVLSDGWFLPGGQSLSSSGSLRVEGDWSNAAFPLVAGLIGSGVTLSGLDLDSPQGDKAIVAVLKNFGASITVSGDRVTAAPSRLQGCTVDMREIPDALPALAVAAAYAEGETRFINAGRLRLKESDRLSAVAALLHSLGAEAEEQPEALIVRGGRPLSGGRVDGFGDHRIVMAAAVAASAAGGEVTITGAQAVEKSYPAFFEHFNSLGGNTHVL